MTKKTKLPGKNPGLRLVTAGESAGLPGKNPKKPKTREKDVSARTVKAKTKPGKLPVKKSTKALPKGKKPEASKRRRQSTKKARPAGKAVPPAPPVVDPRIEALRQVADWILRGENEVSIEEAIKAKFPDENATELLADTFRIYRRARRNESRAPADLACRRPPRALPEDRRNPRL